MRSPLRDLAFVLALLWTMAAVHTGPAEEWNVQALKSINEALQMRPNMGKAKNVILFLGDGMGVSTVTAARIYKGQRQGRKGEETVLNFETFPHVALSKTYNVDKQTADSAGTATAFLCGVKANSGTVGVDSGVARKECQNVEQGKVTSILKWFHQAGKSTGIVTTSRITHATPAAAYAHSPERNWEGDRDMMEQDVDSLCRDKVKDISAQLVDDNPFIKVLLGGGRRTFLPMDSIHPDTQENNTKNGRRDSRNLIEEWRQLKPNNAQYVWNRLQLDEVDDQSTEYLLGLFSPSNMDYELNREEGRQPSLSDMVRKAVNILSNDPNGFFLLVEGARIDHAHHDNLAHLALADTVAFDDAVDVAMDMTQGEDTLAVVTADHSHVFNIAGYPERGNDILGLVKPVKEAEAPFDGMPYATLVYANGPGPTRTNLTNVDTASIDHQQSVLVQMRWETHGAEDVAIYAKGPMAHLFHGVHEQHYIAHVMAYAACVGPYAQQCDREGGGGVGGGGGGGGGGKRGSPSTFCNGCGGIHTVSITFLFIFWSTLILSLE